MIEKKARQNTKSSKLDRHNKASICYFKRPDLRKKEENSFRNSQFFVMNFLQRIQNQ
jgi:hypothetical protein